MPALDCLLSLRFVHDIPFNQISRLGSAQLNILRNPALVPVGEYLEERFGTPFIPSFPHGLSDTLVFLESAARHCGVDGRDAVERERSLQADMIAAFGDLNGSRAVFDDPWPGQEGLTAAQELAGVLGLFPGQERYPPAGHPLGRYGRHETDAAPLEEGDPCLNATIPSGHVL